MTPYQFGMPQIPSSIGRPQHANIPSQLGNSQFGPSNFQLIGFNLAPFNSMVHMASFRSPVMPNITSPSLVNILNSAPARDLFQFLDSGATNHVVTDDASLHEQIEYQGSNKLTVGNWQNLDITHLGNAFIPSFLTFVKLNNMSVVPNIAKNLLSISQLTKDNELLLNFMLTVVYLRRRWGRFSLRVYLKEVCTNFWFMDFSHVIFLQVNQKLLLPTLLVLAIALLFWVLLIVQISLALPFTLEIIIPQTLLYFIDSLVILLIELCFKFFNVVIRRFLVARISYVMLVNMVNIIQCIYFIL